MNQYGKNSGEMATLEKTWPKAHKVLLILTVLLLAAFVAGYVFILMPLYERHYESKDALEKERTTVQQSEWDSSETGIANATKLYTLAIGSKKSPAAKEKSDALLENATGYLQKMVDDVKEASKNPSITKDGKKTYSDKYDEVKKYLQSKSIELVPSVYGLGRVSEGNYYNMTLKLLLTRDVVDLLLKHRMTVEQTVEEYAPEADSIFVEETEDVVRIHASEIYTLPVKTYVLRSDGEPYLLEIPLRITASGEMADFAAFASELQADKRCYTLTNMEIQTVKPQLMTAGRSQLVASQEDAKRVHLEKIRVTFVSTGFVKPEVDKMKEELEKLNNPEGEKRKSVPKEEEASEKPLGI
ncbi:MAG: hypothetical protein J6X55_15655 [Victivallales bacterium]|nr:hypothetical protein [Victivallales bacterium]